METAPPGTSLTFEVTYSSPILSVGMSVYDTSSTSPVLVAGPTLMGVAGPGNTYYGKFTGQENKSYVIFKAVYTDDSLTVLDTSYSQASESIVMVDAGGGGGSSSGCELIGMIQSSPILIGLIEC